jgi:hypothetical protein
MIGQNWIIAIIAVESIGLVLFMLRVLKLRRQVRCLHFCFFKISDWGINKLDKVIEYYNEEYGAQHCPFLDYKKEWDAKVDYLFAMIKRAGIHVPADNYIQYSAEDLRI